MALGAAGARVIAVGRTEGRAGGPGRRDPAERRPRARPWSPMDLTNVAGESISLAERSSSATRNSMCMVHAAAMLGGLRPVSHIPPEIWDKVVATNLTCAYPADPIAGAPFEGERRRPGDLPDVWTGDATQGVLGFVRRDQGRSRSPGALLGRRSGRLAIAASSILLDPGRMRTRMREQAYPGEDPATLPDPAEIGPLDPRAGSRVPDPGPPRRGRQVTTTG